MNTSENLVAPEINRTRILEIVPKDSLEILGQKGITPNQVVQLFEKLLPNDKTIEGQFRDAVMKRSLKSKPPPNVKEIAVKANILTRIFNILFEKQSELPTEIAELRWKARLQIVLLAKPEIVDEINNFMQRFLNEQKIHFGLMRSVVSNFIRVNRGIYNPEIVTEILTEPKEINYLLNHVCKTHTSRKIKKSEQ